MMLTTYEIERHFRDRQAAQLQEAERQRLGRHARRPKSRLMKFLARQTEQRLNSQNHEESALCSA